MRFFLFILWLLHWLPLPVLGRLGKCLGTVCYYMMKNRRHIALTNLRLCFPDIPEKERRKIAREHFQGYGRSIFRTGDSLVGPGGENQKTHSCRTRRPFR